MASWVLTWGGSRGWARGWPGWFVHRWVVVCAGGMCKVLPLLLTPQKWQSGFGSLSILYTICPIRTCTWLLLVPSCFLVSVVGRDVCPGAGIAAKGPRSQVPAHHRTFCCALGLFRSGWPDTYTNHHSLGGLSGIQPSDLFVEPPARPLGSVLDCGFWGGWGLGFL